MKKPSPAKSRASKASPAKSRASKASSAKSSPLEFLAKAQKDVKLSARVTAAVERGNKLTAEEVVQIAEEFGYTFTKREFERDVKKSIATRFAAGEEALGDIVGPTKVKQALESSCAKGCLSYTKSWHPRGFKV